MPAELDGDGAAEGALVAVQHHLGGVHERLPLTGHRGTLLRPCLPGQVPWAAITVGVRVSVVHRRGGTEEAS
jgi:hypothetical protein